MLTAKIEHNATHVSLLKKIVNTYTQIMKESTLFFTSSSGQQKDIRLRIIKRKFEI